MWLFACTINLKEKSLRLESWKGFSREELQGNLDKLIIKMVNNEFTLLCHCRRHHENRKRVSKIFSIVFLEVECKFSQKSNKSKYCAKDIKCKTAQNSQLDNQANKPYFYPVKRSSPHVYLRKVNLTNEMI